MRQYFSRPDGYAGLCGHLRCAVAERVIDGAPEFMRAVRALFIADAHVSRRTTDADLSAFAARMTALSPDIALYGGDYADEPANVLRFFRAMAALRPRLGGFAVLGNNDREAFPDIDPLRRAASAAGVHLLVNESRKVALPGGVLVIAGVDDLKHGAPEEALAIPGPAPDRYRVLLSHFPMLPERAPDLVLSGHTHGGQFNLLGITPYAVGFEPREHTNGMRHVIAGLHREGNVRLLVSKGIGASRIPLRIGVRPEVNLLRFG